MSERMEHKKRHYERMRYVAEVEKWLDREPSPARIFAHAKWKRERPVKPGCLV